jgi:O-antigen/teichoic acid export membrane protein
MLIKNIYIRLGTNFFTAGIGLISSILIIKTFGAEVYGKIFYYYSLAGIFTIFTDLGLSTAYNKFLASEENPRTIITYIFLQVFLIVIYIFILFFAYFLKFKNDGINNKLFFIAFAVAVFDLIGQFFTATLIGKRDFSYLSKLEIITSLTVFAYNLIVCFVITSKYYLAANRVVLHLVTITAGMLYFYNHKLIKVYRPRWGDVKKYLYYSLPLAFSSIVSQFVVNIDNLIVGKLIGMTELGLYQIALRCYQAIDKFIKPVTNTMFSELVHRINNIPSFFHKKFRDLVQVLNLFGGILALGLIFLSTPAINLFFKPEYSRSAFILKFFSLAVLAKLFWRPYGQVILAIEKHKIGSYLQPLSLLVRIGCYYLLIPLTIGNFYLGAAALPLTEFILWIFPVGLVEMAILRKKYGNLHVGEIAIKIWLPLVLIIFSGLLISRSVVMLPVVLVLFLTVEYFLGIVTRQRLSELVAPLKMIYNGRGSLLWARRKGGC